MRRLICPALFLLTACAGGPKPVGISIHEVPVATPVPCLVADQLPVEPPKVSDRLTGDARTDLLIVSESALELRRYSGALRALLTGCME